MDGPFMNVAEFQCLNTTAPGCGNAARQLASLKLYVRLSTLLGNGTMQMFKDF